MRGDVRTTTRVSPGRQLSVCDRCAILTSARGSKLVQEEGRSNAEARLVVASRATVTSGKVVSSRVLRRVRYRQVVAMKCGTGKGKLPVTVVVPVSWLPIIRQVVGD
jgi:hypothetical protein